MHRFVSSLGCFGIGFVTCLFSGDNRLAAEAPQAPMNPAGLELFEKKIRPALVTFCYECHAEESDDIGGGLLLDSRHGWRVGGESGPAIKPRSPRDSLLMQAIEYRGMEMPPDEKMPDELIRSFRRWIALGSPDPRQTKSQGKMKKLTQDPDTESQKLWSLQPIGHPDVPQLADAGWAQVDLDRFILQELSTNQLSPNPLADPTTLLRRLYFDLIGLPPTPDELRAFVDEPSQSHYAEIVDQLLSSPHFGERWGRHWLDVARYGESMGSSRDVLLIHAWRYRDYVIDAFNRDLPYDRFITEQLAGDLLSIKEEPAEQRLRLLTATGLLAIGSKSLNGGNLPNDIADDQIDVVSKAFLGLTVSCARCHDHKFDPIPTADYYALAGIFLSTDTRYGGNTKRPKNAKERSKAYLRVGGELDVQLAKKIENAQKQIAALRKQVGSSQRRVASLRDRVPGDYRNDLDKTIDAAKPKAEQTAIRQYQGALKNLRKREELLKTAIENAPEDDTVYLVAVQDKSKAVDTKILIRGEKDQRGETVPRGFLSACADSLPKRDTQITDQTSGRLQLARWIAQAEHPLTSRVAVNRIWQHLMGTGLVESVDNFGSTGTPPSHPELLDYLAQRFTQTHHWSIKSMVRELVLSSTYQQSSAYEAQAYELDPANRLRWRMTRRRLEAEPIRDAILAISKLLEREPFDGSLVNQIGEGEVGRGIDTSVLEKPFHYRSVYLPIIRGIVPEPLALFDFPEPSNVQGSRDSSVTPAQSLYLMNSDFIARAAEQFATTLLQEPSLTNDAQRIEYAYLACFSKPPTPQQVALGQGFLNDFVDSIGDSEDDHWQAWSVYCQTLFASAPFRFID